jgi:actin-like ATPase involved in cell morphogenesis
MTSSDVVSVYLQELWAMVTSYYGRRREQLHFDVVITWPACWSSETFERFRIAVDRSGISQQARTVNWVEEGIAAAHGILHHMSQNEALVRNVSRLIPTL